MMTEVELKLDADFKAGNFPCYRVNENGEGEWFLWRFDTPDRAHIAMTDPDRAKLVEWINSHPLTW